MVAVSSRRRQRTRAGALARAGGVAALVIGLDQLTKHTVASGIAPGVGERVLPGVRLVHVRNAGVAFSLLSGGGPLVLAVTLLALALLTGYLMLRPWRRLLWLPTGLLVGGAIGNLIDRIASGAVTDFIKLPDWPAFNLADVAITIGVIALLAVLELGGRRERC
jgi:signal peptidase II